MRLNHAAQRMKKVICPWEESGGMFQAAKVANLFELAAYQAVFWV